MLLVWHHEFWSYKRYSRKDSNVKSKPTTRCDSSRYKQPQKTCDMNTNKCTNIDKNQDEAKVEYGVWNPFRSKLAAIILGGVDNIWIYSLLRQRAQINSLIEEAILETEEKGTTLLTLGLLNQGEEVNRNGELFIISHPQLKVKLVNGSSPAVAVVLNNIPKGTTQVSGRGEYQAFRFQYRDGEGHTLLMAGRLFLQYVVDAWCCVERGRLQWVQLHQSKIRSALCNNIVDGVNHGDISSADVGKRIVLPSSFTGGFKYMQQNFQPSIVV